ncbi:MAG: NAD(P)H-binding protein [Clostridiales bacterium]|nr:NAD(P)H-binding protein [Clostridiales bacterium]
MKVFVVGGTGFLGYYSTLELLKRGNQVATISLPDIKIGEWFPSDVEVEHGNVFEMSSARLKELFTGYDGLVYAVGPDDRITPEGDAYEFFHERLVEGSGRVVAAAREAGVKRCVVLGSYFAHFARKNPEWKLAEHHPYVRCRLEQVKKVMDEGKGEMDVMVLELPYIFGIMPEREPIWKDVIVRMLYESKTIRYPKGGTAMITAETVADAVAGALENGENGRCYAVGDANKSWIELLSLMLKSMEMEEKKIKTVPTFIMTQVGKRMRAKDFEKGREAGLNYVHLFKDIQTRYLYIDADTVKKELSYSGGEVDEAIAETAKKCLELLEGEKTNMN